MMRRIMKIDQAVSQRRLLSVTLQNTVKDLVLKIKNKKEEIKELLKTNDELDQRVIQNFR